MDSFIHTLGTFPQVWYLKEEIRKHTNEWDHMTTLFVCDLSFADDDKRIAVSLEAVKRVLFLARKDTKDYCDQDAFNHTYESKFHEVVSCRKINHELKGDDLEGLRHLTFKESEGE